jgi:hypothetical protein
MVIITVVAAVVLVCVGALLGATFTARVLQPRLDRRAAEQAEERRRLAKAWAAIRPQRGECPRCTNPLPQGDTQFAPTVAQD